MDTNINGAGNGATTAATEKAKVVANHPMRDLLMRLASSKKTNLILKEGELVRGVVIEKRPKQLYVDLGSHGTGIVYGAEYLNASTIIKSLEPGSEIFAKVVDLDNEKGYVELSLKEADKQKSWELAQAAKDKDEVITVTISGYNRGGLVADVFGAQAFMPASQLSVEHYPRVGPDQNKIIEALRAFVGQPLNVKIIAADQKNNKLIISERAATETNLKELLSKYTVGDVVDGVISGVADFGAFIRLVDNPELEGLVHLSELDHRLIDNPKSIVSVGDLVKAKIIDIKDSRISLSLKALKENPWDKVLERYAENQTIIGEISKFNPFGALVKIDDDFQGMIHVSEFGSLDKMRAELEMGKSYPFVIQAIKPQDKRILLGLEKKSE